MCKPDRLIQHIGMCRFAQFCKAPFVVEDEQHVFHAIPPVVRQLTRDLLDSRREQEKSTAHATPRKAVSVPDHATVFNLTS